MEGLKTRYFPPSISLTAVKINTGGMVALKTHRRVGTDRSEWGRQEWAFKGEEWAVHAT